MKDIFEKVEFFAGLDGKILSKVADSAVLRTFERDDVIVRQGEMGLGMYVIVRGRVKVEAQQGQATLLLAELGPDQCFAEVSLVDNKPRSATVTALEQTECLLLTRDAFVNLMNRFPEIPIRVARVLATRLRSANDALASQAPGQAGGADGTAGPGPAPAPPAAAPPTDPPARPARDQKGRVQDAMIALFENLYAMRVFTRFSVAMLGCPVEGTASELLAEIRVGDVKALVVPSDAAVEVRIAAREVGAFTLSVLTPYSAPRRFPPRDIEPGEDVRVSLQRGTVRFCVCRAGASDRGERGPS